MDHFLSENILPYLQNVINTLLGEVCCHFTVKLVSDEGCIDVYLKRSNEDRLIDASNCSGYEGDIINIIFRFAFSKINGFLDTDFFIIDEGIKFSDANNKEVIKRVIEYMRDSYNWIIMISHDDFIKDFYDVDLKIEKISKTESHINTKTKDDISDESCSDSDSGEVDSETDVTSSESDNSFDESESKESVDNVKNKKKTKSRKR
jgi:hypothetical protein